MSVLVAQALSFTCLCATAGLVVAERNGKSLARGVFKMAASAAFVLVAVALGAVESTYGRWVLAALCLGLVGDALLLSQRTAAFLAGLGAFLASHVCFAVAFTVGRFSGE